MLARIHAWDWRSVACEPIICVNGEEYKRLRLRCRAYASSGCAAAAKNTTRCWKSFRLVYAKCFPRRGQRAHWGDARVREFAVRRVELTGGSGLEIARDFCLARWT